ncbi:hypothetical protein DTO271G3_7431 [Paecilomyces variotii]|nr:hypothetical protein DTO271G3_7431 [Paecilomyces variotii]
MPSGQIYLAGRLDLICQLEDKGIRTELAHQAVSGNETVDEHAKEAAQGPEDSLKSLNRTYALRLRPNADSVERQKPSGREQAADRDINKEDTPSSVRSDFAKRQRRF